jgi:hypothetical protein
MLNIAARGQQYARHSVEPDKTIGEIPTRHRTRGIALAMPLIHSRNQQRHFQQDQSTFSFLASLAE